MTDAVGAYSWFSHCRSGPSGPINDDHRWTISNSELNKAYAATNLAQRRRTIATAEVAATWMGERNKDRLTLAAITLRGRECLAIRVNHARSENIFFCRGTASWVSLGRPRQSPTGSCSSRAGRKGNTISSDRAALEQSKGRTVMSDGLHRISVADARRCSVEATCSRSPC